MPLWGKIGEKCDHSNKKRKEVCPAAPGISVPGCLHREREPHYTRGHPNLHFLAPTVFMSGVF